ncbi:MAG: hypothetical protein V2A66_02860 [Pseudomonadota bacterium]
MGGGEPKVSAVRTIAVAASKTVAKTSPDPKAVDHCESGPNWNFLRCAYEWLKSIDSTSPHYAFSNGHYRGWGSVDAR